MRSTGRTRVVAAGAALTVSLLALAGLAGPAWPSPTAAPSAAPGSAASWLAGDTATEAMVDLETKMSDSLQYGHAVPVVFDSADQLPGHVVSAPYWGDTALWTGVYLGGESMRYQVATAHLAALAPESGGGTGGSASGDANGRSGDTNGGTGGSASGDANGRSGDTNGGSGGSAAGSGDTSGGSGGQRAFWTRQRNEALARVRTILVGEHRDINIAQDWTGTLKVPPAVNTTDPTGPHTADFGGGIIHGQRGMVTRGCTPVGRGPLGIHPPDSDPAHPVDDHSNHVYEITWTHGDGGTYYCETSPSRDTYAGLTFGMLTAFDLVGPDQPALRAQIRDDILAMAAFLVRYGWNFPRPNGYVGTHSDEDGFISPLMAHVPLARLNIANSARRVADLAGSAAQRRTWDGIWTEELASQGPLLRPAFEVDTAQPDQGYFKFNLDHLLAFNLLRTTAEPARSLIAGGVAVMDKTTRNDANAHFEGILYAVTGDQARRDDAVTHLGQWLDYRRNTAGGVAVRNSQRCGAALTCVPQDQDAMTFDQAPGQPVTWYPGSPEAPPLSQAAGPRAAGPLPIADRPPADFLWQRAPTDLDGQQSASWREPGIDFLTPYWMLRYSTEVAPPPARPLPAWAGPAHS